MWTKLARLHRPLPAPRRSRFLVAVCVIVASACGTQAPPRGSEADQPSAAETASVDSSPATLAEGKRIFRFDTFGDEQFWTDTARMHEVVQKSVSPATALKVGLKVDADAIPRANKSA